MVTMEKTEYERLLITYTRFSSAINLTSFNLGIPHLLNINWPHFRGP